MKNCFFFKLLAILLCAASLLGIAGGVAGTLVLVENNLYHKTVDQMLSQRQEASAAEFAVQTALSYASRELGGCPPDMVLRYHRTLAGNYGYSVLDAEGNVLESVNPELKDTAAVYTFPGSGQYMHLVSSETETEKLARQTAARMDAIRRGLTDQSGNTVPPEGILVSQVLFTNRERIPVYEAMGSLSDCSSTFYYSDANNLQSSSYDHEPQQRIGFLYNDAEGQLAYRSFLEENESDFQPAEVCGVLFLGYENDFLFQTENDEGLGILTLENGHVCFSSYPPEAIPEETVPETTVETVPETTAETLPETTAETAVIPSEPVEETHDSSASEDATEAASSASALPEETVETQPEPAETDPGLINGKPLEMYQVNRTEYIDSVTGEHTTAKYVYLPLPELTVEVYADGSSQANAELYHVLRLLRQYRSFLLPVIGVSLLLFLMSAVYLCMAAGRKPKTDEIRAGGINRLPLDVYLLLGILLGTGAAALAVAGVPTFLRSDFLLGCTLGVSAAFVCCLVFTGFCFAFAAQIKTGGGYWWRNTLSVRLVRLILKLTGRIRLLLTERILPWLTALVGLCWKILRKLLIRLYAHFRNFTRFAGTKLNHFFSLIPLTWQWVLSGFLIVIVIFATEGHWLSFVLGLCLVLYGSHCFGILLATARKMGKGDLDTKITSKIMIGSFKDFAKDLNALADVAKIAAQKQLKSERMKTELITNVSHDIKTPLTSIINYVDLLQKPHSEEEEEQYLEVLDRQSQRLKKLVEDLMDMSKASTGNMAVEITTLDAVEAVNQALGEFSDKLERARLYPVFRHAEDSVPMMADGKLVWRVLSNLLSNVVKYGMPGTRIYLDLTHVNGKVIISLKNISREELNINAEELMERFVRGDISRNTEGSGLGLNIAKSLMQLQEGSLQLLVDGDLFKVTLVFPDAH